MQRHILSIPALVFTALTLSAAFYFSTPSIAQEATPQAQSGQAFAISPPLLELDADPGDTVEARLKFSNISNGPLDVRAEFNNFGARNETGDPNIVFDEDDDDQPDSLKNWITPQPTFTIDARQTESITFPITVPENAEPGGHYAVIRFIGTAPEAAANDVALSASIGTLVLLRVSGDVTENATVEEFYSAAGNYSKTGFFEAGPIRLVERLRNTGNIHVKPTGNVEIKDMFGKVVTSQRVNGSPEQEDNQPKSILPNSVRRFDQELDFGNNWMLGRYEATMTVSYGEGATPLTATTSFWVVPYRLAAIIIVAAVAAFFGLKYGLRRYKQHVIKQSKRR